MSATELVSTHGKDGEEYADVPAVDKPASPETESAGPQPHPDGGIEAWLQVPGGFCLFFNSWGILNAFGVYQVNFLLLATMMQTLIGNRLTTSRDNCSKPLRQRYHGLAL